MRKINVYGIEYTYILSENGTTIFKKDGELLYHSPVVLSNETAIWALIEALDRKK